ncbi:MAG: polynucleotide adenylyltransferase PcnB [Spirochaetaceae bacterium]|nr:polynucleotide adenylyltransferase PcnB [Spirochaetaceae bacterium]
MRVRYTAEKNGKPVKKAIVYTRDEHGIDFSDVDPEAVAIVSRLRSQGFETYIVGGAVRDLILGKKPKDFDIVSEANPSKIKKLFYNARIIGQRFRLVHVYFGEKRFEVSTFRSLKDGLSGNTFGDIEEDVLRRDFSINALFYDPLTQLVIDYVEGMRDMWNKKLRPLIPLARIFTDDPVRMIRAVKYSTSTGFKLSLRIRWMIKKQAALLRDVSPSRLTEEMLKIIQSPWADAIVDHLEELGVYAYLQPGAAQLMKNKEFRKRYIQSFSSPERRDFPGEAVAALIRDYLEDEAQDGTFRWDPEPENYKLMFLAVRQFVLPMSPPKIELDRALRLIFKEHGITVKKIRFLDRENRERREKREKEGASIPEEMEKREVSSAPEDSSKEEKPGEVGILEKKKIKPRRRRSHKPKDESF